MLADLSCSPTPDFTDYDLSKYLAPVPILPTMTSRSCAWNCTFCAIPFASGKFRNRQATQVVDEMDRLHEQTGGTHFMFVDEIMTLHSMRTVGAELIRRGSPYFWYSETRFTKGLDTGVAKVLRDSGCRRLNLGLESYNQSTLDLMEKQVDVAVIEPNLRAMIAAKVPFHLFTIAGFPGETEEQTRRTVEFADRMVRDAEDAGLPYATWAMGPFVLDLLSPVGRDPARFGVTVVPPGEHEDLALSAQYRVARGVSQAAAARLAGRMVSGASDHEQSQWHPAFVDPRAEELTFLRAALELPVPRAEVRAELVPHAGEPELRLASDALLLDVCADPGAPRWAVVSVERGLLVELPAELADAFRLNGRLVENGQSVVHRRLLRALRRFGLLAADGEQRIDPRSAVDRLWLGPEVGVRLVPDDDGATIATSAVTGRRVRLTGVADALLRVGPEGVTAAELAGGDQAMRDRLAALACRLYRLGVLAVDVDRTDTEPTSGMVVAAAR